MAKQKGILNDFVQVDHAVLVVGWDVQGNIGSSKTDMVPTGVKMDISVCL